MEEVQNVSDDNFLSSSIFSLTYLLKLEVELVWIFWQTVCLQEIHWGISAAQLASISEISSFCGLKKKSGSMDSWKSWWQSLPRFTIWSRELIHIPKSRLRLGHSVFPELWLDVWQCISSLGQQKYQQLSSGKRKIFWFNASRRLRDRNF